jgi:hypothetical protein
MMNFPFPFLYARFPAFHHTLRPLLRNCIESFCCICDVKGAIQNSEKSRSIIQHFTVFAERLDEVSSRMRLKSELNLTIIESFIQSERGFNTESFLALKIDDRNFLLKKI